MEVETAALLAAARRAKLFEHNTNRGNEAEEAIRRWLRTWLEPEYTISSGEIIDSVEPAGAPVSRQQDGIVHVNSLHGRRYTLPSGMRLVPVETVVATVEVKLTLTKKEFELADVAAAELLEKQLSLCSRSVINGREWPGDPQLLPLREVRDRVTTAIVGYFGPTDTSTLLEWVRDAKAIELVCCLEGGCVLRSHNGPRGAGAYVSERRKALSAFVDALYSGFDSYRAACEDWLPDAWAYGEEPPFVRDSTEKPSSK